MKNLKAMMSLIRPLNCLITFLTIIVACLICTDSINYSLFLVAGLIGALVNAGGNIINDYFDIEIDKINRPKRPLPKGLISSKNVLELYFYFTFFTLTLSYHNLGANAFKIVIVTSVLMFFYSYKLKGIPLVGNIVVAFSTGLAFLFGSVVAENIYCGIIPALFAFLISLIRELVKDIEDIEGDGTIGIKTYPIKYGVYSTVKLINALSVILIISTSVPFILKIYNLYYFIFVSLFVNGILTFVSLELKKNLLPKRLRKVSNLLKLGMVFGVIAIFIGTKI